MKTTISDKLILISTITVIVSIFLLAFFPRDKNPLNTAGITSISFFEDKQGNLRLEEIRQNPDLFTTAGTATLFRGLSDSAYWLRFRIVAPEQQSGRRYLQIRNTDLEDIVVFFPGEPAMLAGKKAPQKDTPIPLASWNICVPTNLSVNDDVYVRVKSDSVLVIPLKIADATAMQAWSFGESSAAAFFFGALAAMLVMSLLASIVLWNRNFFVYDSFLFFMLVYLLQMEGLRNIIPIPYELCRHISWVGLCAAGISILLFSRSFLNSRETSPGFDAVMLASMVLYGAQIMVGLFSLTLAVRIAYYVDAIIPVLIIAKTVRQWKSGRRELRFFIIAWGMLFCGNTVLIFSTLIQPQLPSRPFFLAGTLLATFFFTLAIFDIIRRDLRERDELVMREKYYIDLSRTDTLTGLYNRQYLKELITRLENDRELPAEVALVMLDLDNFKTINDNYGHLVGDMILTRTGSKIKKHIRRSDIACRYGGDEFLIVLPGADRMVASRIADEIREDILNEKNYSETGEEIRITVSVGITESRIDDSFDGMFLRADAALYQAKKTGRNRIATL
jgi:diguanylate cyclase (GGDEF)-like protein